MRAAPDLLLGLLLALAGCAATGGPDLVPLGPILARADALAASPPSAGDALARADALRAQAGAIPGPSGPDPRVAELQARAEALRAPVLTEAERARLAQGASLP